MYGTDGKIYELRVDPESGAQYYACAETGKSFWLQDCIEKCFTAQGDPFFFNTISGESFWDNPIEEEDEEEAATKEQDEGQESSSHALKRHSTSFQSYTVEEVFAELGAGFQALMADGFHRDQSKDFELTSNEKHFKEAVKDEINEIINS